MLAKIMIVIEIQIFFPLFSSSPRDFYHFIAGDGAHHGSRSVASPEQIVKTLRAIAPIRISVIATNTDGSDKTELTSFVVFHIN